MSKDPVPQPVPEESRPNRLGRLSKRRSEILEKAAHLFCLKGYDSTSMSDIADEVGITKAGLYYFVESKEHLLYLITDYGLDLLDETVLAPLRNVKDPKELLHQLIARHVHMVIHRPREVTIILHERTALTGVYREKILKRKKDYIEYVRAILVRLRGLGAARDVDPTAATFFLLGAMNWIYQWYKVDGRLTEQALVEELKTLFTEGFLKKGSE
ncbi:MAG: TetR/AcrR family transcriptional regulator [Acidobacteriota bacterium]